MTGNLVAQIEALGGTVESQHPNYRLCRARVPVNSLEALATDPAIQYIRPAFKPITNKIDTSEGDVAHAADEARTTFGVDGTGVRLCALSDSVDYLALLQAAGDLPAVTSPPRAKRKPGHQRGNRDARDPSRFGPRGRALLRHRL